MDGELYQADVGVLRGGEENRFVIFSAQAVDELVDLILDLVIDVAGLILELGGAIFHLLTAVLQVPEAGYQLCGSVIQIAETVIESVIPSERSPRPLSSVSAPE